MDRHHTIKRDQKTLVERNNHIHVRGNHLEKIEGDLSHHVGGNRNERVGTVYAVESGKEIHIKSGAKVIIECGMRISVVGSGGFIDIGPGGVAIQGSLVLINSGGSPGTGSGSSPAEPLPPLTGMAAEVAQEQGGGGKGPEPPAKTPRGGAAKEPVVRKTYRKKPGLDQVTNDPYVDAELEKAWNDSNPNDPEVRRGLPGSTKKEQGGWVVWNKKSGQLEVQRVAGGTRDGLGPIVGTRPQDNDNQEVVAWFHTHPNTTKEGYQHGPSPGDVAWQKSEAKAPGIIETHEGRKTIPYQ